MRFPSRAIKSDRLGRLPLTSLIDIVFLLIIFFLVTARFTAAEAELAAALQSKRQSGGKAADLQPQIVNVTVDTSGQVLFVIGERAITDKVTLTAVLRELPKEGGAFLRVNGDAPVGAAAAAWQACKDAGFENVSYVSGN